jgi:predicted nucleic acid-binding Zn ribbon protein
VPDRLRLAREALDRAKADALAKGNRPAHAHDQKSERKTPADPPRSRGPGRRDRRDDPDRLGAAIEGLIDARGWQESAAVGSVFGRWAEIVGPELAAHTRPDGLADGELTVTADSTAWATQVPRPRQRASPASQAWGVAGPRRPRPPRHLWLKA